MKILLVILLLPVAAALGGEPSTVKLQENRWTLQNETLRATVAFTEGALRLDSLYNRETHAECLAGKPALFAHVVDGAKCDAGWKLAGSCVRDIELFAVHWGKRLEVTLTRPKLTVRQVFEIYNDRAGIRYFSFLKNNTGQEVTVGSSELLNLDLPAADRTLHYAAGVAAWKHTRDALPPGTRNCIVLYDAGHGVFLSPENNWATCLEPGPMKGLATEKLLNIEANPVVRVTTNPKAVQLTLFPHEEVEYFSVDFGVFTGDLVDARVAAAEHFRKRFKFVGPMHQLATNDWQWGAYNGFSTPARSDSNYRTRVIPKASAAGFDRINIDDYWYSPEDSCDPVHDWTDMAALGDAIVKAGMKPGHWFSLQGRYCHRGWGEGRDCADPANVDFKIKQMRETMIGKYHSAWDQIDGGLLWKTGTNTSYSHPNDSVYRKVLGLKRYMNTVAGENPDFLMQVTCEIDNPAGPGGSAAVGNQNVGLIHLADNGIVGMFRRTETHDDLRDLFACVGLFPLEGLLSTWGEDRISPTSWQDSPMWFYQFLLARHTMIYSRPWEWSPESVVRFRKFNDWRKSPRVAALLNELMRPVYNGEDLEKNEGPWAWMFTDEKRTKALLIVLNHLHLAPGNAFAAKLHWLDPAKNYLVTDITMQPDGKFKTETVGTLSGKRLRNAGLPVDLNAGAEPCVAFWLEETAGEPAEISSRTPRSK